MEKDRVIELLAEFCRATAEADGGNYVFSLHPLRNNGHKLDLPRSTAEKVVISLDSLETYEKTALASSKSFEAVVREESGVNTFTCNQLAFQHSSKEWAPVERG
jgi:hypothetical protein